MTTHQVNAIAELLSALGWARPQLEATGSWPNQWSLIIAGHRFNEYQAAREYIAAHRGGEPQAPWPERRS